MRLLRQVVLGVFPILLFSILWFSEAFSQQRWIKTYGGVYDDRGYSVQQTSDGCYIIAGYTMNGGYYKVYLIKVNPSGDTLWTRTYRVADGGDFGYFVQQTADGGYVITGRSYSFGPGGDDVLLIKTNAFGDTLWAKTYGGTGVDYGWSVQQTSDSGYIIAGQTTSFGRGYYDAYLVKTNVQGDTLWSKTFGGSSYDDIRSVQQTFDGGYIITGYTKSYQRLPGDTLGKVYLIKTNSQGVALWTQCYGRNFGTDKGYCVRQTSDSGYIIAGSTHTVLGSLKASIIKVDATGDSLWSKIYDGSGLEAYSIRQTSDNGFIITGWYSYLNNHDVFLIKTNALGDTLWTKFFGGSNDEYGYSVQPTSDGGYIIAGYTNSFGAGGNDVYLIKTDANGNVGVETPIRQLDGLTVRRLKITPNPFASFARIPGHEAERFALYDIAGRRVGTYKGERIGMDLRPGVYFLRALEGKAGLARIVKIR